MLRPLDPIRVQPAGFANKTVHGLGINDFRPNRPCLIVEVLATQTEFLEPPGYYIMINCTSTFCTRIVFTCFCSAMALFKLIKPEFGGARGVMVIVVGNGHGDTSSNPGRD